MPYIKQSILWFFVFFQPFLLAEDFQRVEQASNAKAEEAQIVLLGGSHGADGAKSKDRGNLFASAYSQARKLIEARPKERFYLVHERQLEKGFKKLKEELPNTSIEVVNVDNQFLAAINEIIFYNTELATKLIFPDLNPSNTPKEALNILLNELGIRAGLIRSYYMALEIETILKKDPNAKIIFLGGEYHALDRLIYTYLTERGYTLSTLANNPERTLRFLAEDKERSKIPALRDFLHFLDDALGKYARIHISKRDGNAPSAATYLQHCDDCACMIAKLGY